MYSMFGRAIAATYVYIYMRVDRLSESLTGMIRPKISRLPYFILPEGSLAWIIIHRFGNVHTYWYSS